MTKSPHPSSVDKGELLPVTQADRDEAAKFLRGVYGQHGFDSLWAPTIERGAADWHAIVRLVVAVRQAHSLPGTALRAENIKNALLDTTCANMAPIEWDDADWHQVRRALAALTPSPCPGDGWLSIDTAPRDGTWFIADGGGCERPTPMKWNNRIGAWECDAVMLEDWDDQTEGYSRPERWWPIPATSKEDNHSA